ncbi:MAG: serine/threonine-protein kinase [Pseudomonadota bacterium]
MAASNDDGDPLDGVDLNNLGTNYSKRSAASTAAPTIKPGERFAERYEVVRQLGQGGMGAVYLTEDTLTKRQVALKLIHADLVDEESQQRMINEGVNTQKIRNPHVVAIYDVGKHGDQVFLAMEYVEGRPLRHWISENLSSSEHAPLADVLVVIHKILAGLAAAHEQGVVHRDLKPENIMIAGKPSDPDFDLRILDFGIARGVKTTALTGSNRVLGTVDYMAPEQKTSPNAVGPAADIYSVGRMLYEMLMDILPDGVWNPPSLQRGDLPAALDEVIHKTTLAPKNRYQSAAEFAAALDKATQGTAAEKATASVWSSEGAAALREALSRTDTTMAERIEMLKSGFAWVKDNFGAGGSSGGGSGGGASPGGASAGKTRDGGSGDGGGGAPAVGSDRRWLIGGASAALIFLLIIAVASEDTGPPPDVTETTREIFRDEIFDEKREVSREVTREVIQPRTPQVAGRWRIGPGPSFFQVSQRGDTVVGQGPSFYGPIRFSGPLEGAMEVQSLNTGQMVAILQGGLQPRSGGLPGFDWVGTMIDLNSGRSSNLILHINH